MSEADVSSIHDEDLLRRMWQQTEDFSKKKEIRAHMYRLREERLRSLYSPEPMDKKGCEFTSARAHSKSFADQTFQSMKSKEVRDAGSPPKVFTYRGQDIKDLSTAGWNVEADTRSTDDGHTHVRSVHANIEGKYDVEGGKGQFAAVDQQTRAHTEYQSDNCSLTRDEVASNTAACQQEHQQTADGTQFSSTKSTSSSTSKYEQVSSTKHAAVADVAETGSSQMVETSLAKNSENISMQCSGELLARKVEYPDDNTKIIVEKKRLPDGTIVTSTRREMRGATNRSEQYSQHTKTENASYSKQQMSEMTSEDAIDNRSRRGDDIRMDSTVTKKVRDNELKKVQSDCEVKQHKVMAKDTHFETNNTRMKSHDDLHKNIERVDITSDNSDARTSSITRQHDNADESSRSEYQTTYQDDYTKKKISQDLSPTHQAWASTLRADTTHTPRSSSSTSSLRSSISPEKLYRKPSSRAGSPNKNDKHSPTRNNRTSFDTNATTITGRTEEPRLYPTRPSTSPDRKIPHESSPTKSLTREIDSYITPHEVPGYQQPTVSSNIHKRDSPGRKGIYPKETDDRSRADPTPERVSPCKTPSDRSSTSPDRKHTSSTIKTQKDHSKFIEEEVKSSSRFDKTTEQICIDQMNRCSKSPSPSRKPLTKNAELPSSLRKDSPDRRSQSPPKGPVTFESDKHTITKMEKSHSDTSDYKETTNTNVTTKHEKNENSTETTADRGVRHTSPSKFDTYTKRSKYPDATHNEKPTSKRPELFPAGSTETSPRNSVSPSKTVTKTNKYKNTCNFISNEKTTEEYNKKITNERARRLVTPSTSPTRKPKVADTPSTGQSSPTTSVSEIIYFSSPKQLEMNSITTKQVNVEDNETILCVDGKRSPSPTKIPCRSPSIEKHVPPTRDSLPRKSSLKKPFAEVQPSSPAESTPGHKVVKKDNPERAGSPDDIPKKKEKPPLERRETYEERCRKILGMIDDEKNLSTKDDSVFKKTAPKDITKPITKQTPPNITPDATRESSPHKSVSSKHATDFMNIESSISTTTTKHNVRNTTTERRTPTREQSPTKLRDITSTTTNITEKNCDHNSDEEYFITRGTRKQTESPKSSRTTSPSKTTAQRATVRIDEFIATEREQQILEKVHNSLRKLSPKRDSRSPSVERVLKTGASLSDLDIIKEVEKCKEKEKTIHEVNDVTKKSNTRKSLIDRQTKTTRHETAQAKATRQVSPVKKHVPQIAKCEKSSTDRAQTADRSSSPKKPRIPASVSDNKSPQAPKSRDAASPTKKTTTTNRIDKNQKTGLTKQNSFTKTTNKCRSNMVTSTTDNRTIETKVTRTSSDNSIRNKKPSPQRVRSKPEIQVHDISTTKTSKQPAHKAPSRLTTKPKSATSLHTTSADNDVIIDVLQAKSSRENTPERICPTPVSLAEDVGRPRLPDEVSEPDDDITKRAHRTIHEAESIVDDIVEICEDEELFTKITNVDKISESDECLLSVTDKVSKFSTCKPEEHTKPKDAATQFKNTERRVHSDFDEKLLNDDCLLSVSDKVSKFTNAKDDIVTKSRSAVGEGFDYGSTYQDDYIRLSVNDKAHMFVEAAESIHEITKPRQKMDRADLSEVDESLKSDECLLSVSDKVNKFIKTAEQFLNEAQESDKKTQIGQKERFENIKSNNDQITKQANVHDGCDKSSRDNKTPEHLGSFTKETVSSHAKVKDYVSPNLRSDRMPTAKLPTLRSSEAVKKAKALFENIASSQDGVGHSTKLTDIGVIKKSHKTDSADVHHPTLEGGSPNISDNEAEVDGGAQRQQARENTTPERLRQAPLTQHATSKPLSTSTNSDNPTESHNVSTRRGSGKFGVELRRTSDDRTASTERRRSSSERNQPRIEDIYDLELLEQTLEKVVGYEQRRRIRAQIREVKKRTEAAYVLPNTHTRPAHKYISKTKSPERIANGHMKEPVIEKRQRPHSPDKAKPKPTNMRSPTRCPSPEKKSRTLPPPESPKHKSNRFNEYASAYMKKVGLDKDATNVKERRSIQQTEHTEHLKQETTIHNNYSERKTAKDTIDTVTSSKPLARVKSPERKVHDRIYQRSPSPDFRRRKETTTAKEAVVNTVDDNKKTPSKEKPSWVTNRNLKKATDVRTFSSKKVDIDKKYRATSPSKIISKPTDVITSSYGIGPLDADGKPLFGIKALRNGANYQVKGTVVCEEYHSRNGGEPEGSISVTAYSNTPEELEKLLRRRDERPSRLHGLAAITTTKKFGGKTGSTLKEAHTKEERALLEQFTSTNRKADIEIGNEIKLSDNKRENRRSKERVEKREEKILRQSSVKSLTEKYIKQASDNVKSDRGTYPKAGLILRTTTLKESDTRVEHGPGPLEHGSIIPTESLEKNGDRAERSFLNSSTKVTGVQDILARMKNADIVIEQGDNEEDSEARALLNKFLGATVLMAGMKDYVQERPSARTTITTITTQERGKSSTNEIDIESCWDERTLNKLLESCTDYEQRRRIRARIRALMAEQEACAHAVAEALDAADESGDAQERAREITSVSSSVRRDSSEKTVSSSTTTKTCKVIESTRPAPKPVSAFTKFRQLEKQNSTTSPSSPKTPQSPSSPSQPYFKFTDPTLACSAITIKERLLQWCRDKTRGYENVKLENFSTSWSDGLAFCALLHHFLPDAFDYSALTADKRRHNFTLAFKVADEKAGIYPLLDVDDMVAMRKPDWKCVFTYVQAIYRRFKDQD